MTDLRSPSGRPGGEKGLTFRDRALAVSALIFCIAALALYFATRTDLIVVPGIRVALAQRLLLAAAATGFLLLLVSFAEAILIGRIENDAARFNLRRIVRLLAVLGVFLVVLSLVFGNWFTALAPLGILSLILGFALQTPITSFIGWIYILVHTPYKVGDRIRIGEATGDVIDVGYFDTTLWEFGGEYLSTDHPSGRIIKFPNSNILNAAVYNYSWPMFPYVWNEVKFHIAYSSDLEFVAEVMEAVATEEIGEIMSERIRHYRDILADTPVDEIQVQEKPVVLFRVSDNTWLEAIVRYLVDPKQAGTVKTRLIRKMLARLNAEPERVMFPKLDSR